jgi:hypothetical protein
MAKRWWGWISNTHGSSAPFLSPAAGASTLTQLEVQGQASPLTGCSYSNQVTNLPIQSLGGSQPQSSQCPVGSSSATATFGILGVAAMGEDGFVGSPSASWLDTMTITGGTGSGHLIMDFEAFGSAVLTCTPFAIGNGSCGGSVNVQTTVMGITERSVQTISLPGSPAAVSLSVHVDRSFLLALSFRRPATWTALWRVWSWQEAPCREPTIRLKPFRSPRRGSCWPAVQAS